MIYDCFLLYNELDLLEIRLNELNDIVDKFVVIESKTTFSGKPKQLFLDINEERFIKFAPKIIRHITKLPYQKDGNRWDNEKHSFDVMKDALVNIGANPDDIVFVSCVDEIPKASAIKLYLNDIEEHNCLMMYFSYYWLNCKIDSVWPGTILTLFKYLTKPINDLQKSRQRFKKIPNAGWHFSFLGSAEFIADKISAYSHSEFDNDQWTNLKRVQRCIETGEDLFSRGIKHTIVPFDNSFPQYVIDNQQAFQRYIK
jgi:beta-1,4-mannosyl-glycoprotein beta-1,4-N-acetylglucosaminyltransferase